MQLQKPGIIGREDARKTEKTLLCRAYSYENNS